jgi:hypothetical protein
MRNAQALSDPSKEPFHGPFHACPKIFSVLFAVRFHGIKGSFLGLDQRHHEQNRSVNYLACNSLILGSAKMRFQNRHSILSFWENSKSWRNIRLLLSIG